MTQDFKRAVADLEEVTAKYRDQERKADEAWDRWFTKRQAGEKTNGAQASRLANELSYLSAEVACAEGEVWHFADSLGFSDLDEARKLALEENR